MAKEAEAHSAEDKAKRDEIEARNQLDSLVYNIEKMLKENGDKVSGTEKSDVETALADAKKTLEGQPSPAELNAAREKLTAGIAQACRGHVQGQRGGRSECRSASD